MPLNQTPEEQSMQNNSNNSTSRVGNSHSHKTDNVQITPIQTTTENTPDDTHQKLPVPTQYIQINSGTTSRVGNSHLQTTNNAQPTQIQTPTESTPHDTHLKLPASTQCTKTNKTTSRVGNSHLQITNNTQATPMQTSTESTTHDTHLKLPAPTQCTKTNNKTTSRVGNSHLQITNNSQPTPMQTSTECTTHDTHLKLPASTQCTKTNNKTTSRVGNSHLQITSNIQPTPIQTSTECTTHDTHLKLPASTQCTKTNNKTTSRVGNSHLQITSNIQPTPIQTSTECTTHDTHLKLPASTQCTKPTQETPIHIDTQCTKRKQKKKETFQLTDLEKQLAFCKSEIIRLENCCKEYQSTIQILKLKLATTLPEQNNTAQHGATQQPEMQVSSSNTSLDIRLSALEAQMSILKEKMEIQQMIQELRDEKRQMHTLNGMAHKESIGDSEQKQHSTLNHNSIERSIHTQVSEALPKTVEESRQHEEDNQKTNTRQHFLCHGRASTNTHRNRKPTNLELIGQPLFMQANHQGIEANDIQPQHILSHQQQTSQLQFQQPQPQTQQAHSPVMCEIEISNCRKIKFIIAYCYIFVLRE